MKSGNKILVYLLILCYSFFAGGFVNMARWHAQPPFHCVSQQLKTKNGKEIIARNSNQAQWSLKVKYTGGESCFLPGSYTIKSRIPSFVDNDDALLSGVNIFLRYDLSEILRGPPAI